MVAAGSPVLGHLSWVTCPRFNCPRCPGCSGGQPLLQFTLLDFALLYLWSFVLRCLQSNASNIFMTRMHATHFCHHGARRFESQLNASTILCSRWLPAGTHSGRGDAARQLLPFSDVVASARVHASPEMMHWVRQRIRTRNIQVPCLRGRHKCGQKEDLYTMPSRMELPTGFGQWLGNTTMVCLILC